MVAHIADHIESLKSNPFIGKPTDQPGLRILFPVRYPYRVYYEVAHDRIVILHIRHTARDVPKMSDLK